jgi:hypothetical protein
MKIILINEGLKPLEIFKLMLKSEETMIKYSVKETKKKKLRRKP